MGRPRRGSDERAAAERLLQVPAALRERLDAVGAQAEAAAAAAEPIPLAARGRVPLWPIADVRSAAAEGALLLPLGALALDAALDANTDEISTGAGGSPPLRRVFDGAVRERENLRLGTVDADAGGGPAWSSTVRQQQRDLIRRKAEDVVTTIVDGGRCPLDGGAAQLLSGRLEGAGGAAAADDARGSARSRSKGARAGTAICGARASCGRRAPPPSRAARRHCSCASRLGG